MAAGGFMPCASPSSAATCCRYSLGTGFVRVHAFLPCDGRFDGGRPRSLRQHISKIGFHESIECVGHVSTQIPQPMQ